MSEDALKRDTIPAFVGTGSGEGGQKEAGEHDLLSDGRGGEIKGGNSKENHYVTPEKHPDFELI